MLKVEGVREGDGVVVDCSREGPTGGVHVGLSCLLI